MNRHLYNRDGYERKVRPLGKEEDKAACLKLLTQTDILCYSEDHMNKIIEASDYIVFHHRKQNVEDIVGFALVQYIGKKKVLDILLLCAIPNAEHTIVHSVFMFAVIKQCKKLYASSRTVILRKTFLKYGFEHLCGVRDIDEVLVKEIKLRKTNAMRRRYTAKEKPKIVYIDAHIYLKSCTIGSDR